MPHRNTVIKQPIISDKDRPLQKDTYCNRCFLLSKDNPLRFRYFRSELSIRNEQERQRNLGYFVIHPFSTFRAWYDIYIMILYMSVLLTKPVDAGFMKEIFSKKMWFYGKYNIITDILSWVDITLNFFTGFETPDTYSIELRRSLIARRYLFGPYFICDVISSFPKTILHYLKVPSAYNVIYGLVAIFGLFKLIRLITLISCITRTAEYFRIKSKGVLFLLCSMIVSLMIVHWMACLQFTIPRLVRSYFTAESWVQQQDLQNARLLIQYSSCFFKSSAYILGISLELDRIKLPEEYILAMITYFIGKILIAFLWIVLAVAILNSRSVYIEYADKVNQLEEYMKQRQLPLDLRDRISQYYNFRYQRKYFKETVIMRFLSDNLKREVNLHVCKSLIASVTLFSDLSPDEISEVVKYLIPVTFLPNDTIIQSGTNGDAMYFLSSGTVAVYTHSGKEICHLQDGAYFGEISLILKGQIRTATVVAVETSQVYRLNKVDLEKCLLNNKNVYHKLLYQAKIRLKESIDIEEAYKKVLFEQTYQQIST